MEMAESKKTETTLLLDDYLAKYKEAFGLKEVDENSKLPAKFSFMKKYCENKEIRRWLSSLLVNGMDQEAVYTDLKITLDDGTDYSEEEVLAKLRDIWIIECLN